MKEDLYLLNTIFALGPTNMAMAPAPPVQRAGPSSYTARSVATTIPYFPFQKGEDIQLRVLIRALVPP